MPVATRIRSLREARGYSLRNLAEAAGVSPATLSQIESNQTSPSVATLEKLAHGLRVPVAAFFAEPVQGAGGVIIPPDTYWPEIQRICDEYGILLVADEVITAFGRLGQWFGSTHFAIRPDLISFAKGVTSGYLPLGGALVGQRVADVVTTRGGEFTHGFTYSGHPVTCAVALEVVRIMQEEGIVDTVREQTGPDFRQRWATLADHPILGEARSTGMVGALEIVQDKTNRSRFHKDLGAGTLCRDICVENGLVMRAVNDTMIVSPPLISESAHIDELVEKAWRCLDLTAKSLRR